MNKLLTTGQVIDTIEYGQIAISIDDIDLGAIIIIDNEGWLYIKHPHKNHFKPGFNFKREPDETSVSERWLIKDRPEKYDKILIQETFSNYYYEFKGDR